MEDNISQAERIEGAEQIKNLCSEIANELKITLQDVYWATDIIAIHEQYELTIIADSGSTQVNMSREEIEDYPGGAGTEKTKAKLKAELHGIK